MKILKNEVVVITGSSIGIGRETAYNFAKEGCRIVITFYKDQNEAIETYNKCLELGAPEALMISLNVMDNVSIRTAIETITEKFGEISILINNAGVIEWNPLVDQSDEAIENQIRTNLEGLIKITKECLPHITDCIINIASGAGKTGFAGLAVYCASKFGVRGFSQALSKEATGIDVFTINPGTTATRMTDFSGTPPEKVAEIIVNTAKRKYDIKSGGEIDVWEVA